MAKTGSILEEDRQRILRFYAGGCSLTTIGRKFGCSTSYPSQLAQRRGVERGQRDPALVAELEGMSPAAGNLISLEPVIRQKPVRVDLAKPERARHVAPPPANAGGRAEIRRLSRERKLGRTAIAAILRCTYREIDEALADA
jgi:hypothetical protein